MLVYAHEEKKVNVLDFMFEEMRQCVFKKKSCVYAPFIQALIKSQVPASELHRYPIYLPKRNLMWKPPVADELTGAMKGRNPSHEDRATYTEGLTSNIRIIPNAPTMRVLPMDKKKKNVFICGFNNSSTSARLPKCVK